MAFAKAEKKKVWLKLAFTGPSGSGKTMSALRLAKGMGTEGKPWKIAVIDTENGSASLYADKHHFDTLLIDAPYTISKYILGIDEAVAAGYDVLIIDSISHAWAGEGGLMDKKFALDRKPGSNSFTNFNQITPEQNKFVAKLLSAQIHLIVTMRSKQDYVIESNEKGKSVPRKVGMAPIQRDGVEYELSTVFDLAINHYAEVSKDRTGIFDGLNFMVTEETGKKLMDWMTGGAGDLTRIESPAATEKKLAEYVVAVSGKFHGRTLKSIPAGELFYYLMEADQFLSGQATLDTPTNKKILELIERGKKFLTEVGFLKREEDNIPF